MVLINEAYCFPPCIVLSFCLKDVYSPNMCSRLSFNRMPNYMFYNDAEAGSFPFRQIGRYNDFGH